jgi:ABC-2 type transport system permease protein
VTTLPVGLHPVAAAGRVGIAGTDDLARLQRLLPGGPATEPVVDARNGGVPSVDSPPLLATTTARVLVAVAPASRLPRREPRR